MHRPALSFRAARALTVLFLASSAAAAQGDWTLALTVPSSRERSAMVWDEARGEVVLFGGQPDANSIDDTWTWNGARWSRREPAHRPPARYNHGMAFDAARQEVVLFGGGPGLKADTWVWNGTDWTERLPTVSPPGRYDAVLAYDAIRAEVVLFGGSGSSNWLGDTWVWNGLEWSERTPASSPPPRYDHALAWDAARGEVVLFGGMGSSGQLADTWVWNGTTWTQRFPAHSPSARFRHAMAFDAARGRVVLNGNGGPTPDTWLWDGSDWTQATPTRTPSPSYQHAAAYDALRQRVVIFGGMHPWGNPGNSTWLWDGTDWRPALPEARRYAHLAFDADRHEIVLFGGWNWWFVNNDTWVWDGTSWSERLPATRPPGRFWGTMAYDAARHEAVLFGGYGAAGYLGDTWVWDGTTWSPRVPSPSPPSREAAALTYDSLREELVLFGGYREAGTAQQYLGDTWTWNGTAWTLRTPAASPHGREWPMMAFDAARGEAVLFGGYYRESSTDYQLADTWTWDGTNWSERSPLTSPPPSIGGVATYDLGYELLLLQLFNPATWAWDGTNWTDLAPAHSPSASESWSAGAYDADRHQTVLFGGSDGMRVSASTWTWHFSCPPISVAPESLPRAATGRAYEASLFATGGVPPHTFEVTAGALPPGLQLEGTTGLLGGDPTAPGSFPFTATAYDFNHCPGWRTYTLDVDCGTTAHLDHHAPNPSAVGQPVLLELAVTADPVCGAPAPGTAMVRDGTQSCVAPLADGRGACEIAFASAGSRDLTVEYAGAEGFAASASGAVAHTVVRAATAVRIDSALPSPSVVGQPVTVVFTVTPLAPGAGTPPGTVTVSGGGASCTGDLAGGSGSCELAPTSPGEHPLTASYAGNPDFHPSVSAPFVHPVNPAVTITTIVSHLPDPSLAGEPVSVSFTVSASPPGAGVPTGTVTVSDGTAGCGGALVAGGGSCQILLGAAGPRALTATYSGGAGFLPSTSGPVAHQVARAATATAIASHLPSPSLVGEPVHVTWTVSILPPGSGSPTGTVTAHGGGASCSSTVASGGCDLVLTERGTTSLTAEYSGDGDLQASTSPPVGHSVVNTAMDLAASPNPSISGQSVLFTATLTSIPGTAPGSIVFSVDGVPQRPAGLTTGGIGDGVHGLSIATFTTSTLPAGSHTVTASYAGATGYDPVAASVAQEVRVSIGFVATAVTAAEGDGSVALSLTLGEASTLPVSVRVTAASGSAVAGEDFAALSQEILFAPGQTLAPLAVTLLADALPEPNETFSVYLASPEHAVIAPPGEAVVLLRDPGPTDLAAAKSDGLERLRPGDTVSYTLAISGSGPSWADGATVSDPLPPYLTGVTWTCSGSAGARCTPAGAGGIADLVTIPPGGSITYLLTGVFPGGDPGPFVNTVTVTGVPGGSDPDPLNNAATDTDVLWQSALFSDGFESGAIDAWSSGGP